MQWVDSIQDRRRDCVGEAPASTQPDTPPLSPLFNYRKDKYKPHWMTGDETAHGQIVAIVLPREVSAAFSVDAAFECEVKDELCVTLL